MDNNLMTTGDIARALNTTGPTVTKLMGETEPAATIMNGRAKLYTADQVKAVLRAKHASVLAFLGFGDSDESVLTDEPVTI